MNQEELRDKVNFYITNCGIKAKHVARMIGVDESTLSRFRNGTKDLYPKNLQQLKEYLMKFGY